MSVHAFLKHPINRVGEVHKMQCFVENNMFPSILSDAFNDTGARMQDLPYDF